MLFLHMVDLKEKLIKKIKEINRPDVLQEIHRLLEMGSEDQEIYQLSEEQKFVVNEAQEEIRKGEFISNEKANEEVKEWLKKK